jgi:hypothetical protein
MRHVQDTTQTETLRRAYPAAAADTVLAMSATDHLNRAARNRSARNPGRRLRSQEGTVQVAIGAQSR